MSDAANTILKAQELWEIELPLAPDSVFTMENLITSVSVMGVVLEVLLGLFLLGWLAYRAYQPMMRFWLKQKLKSRRIDPRVAAFALAKLLPKKTEASVVESLDNLRFSKTPVDMRTLLDLMRRL